MSRFFGLGLDACCEQMVHTSARGGLGAFRNAHAVTRHGGTGGSLTLINCPESLQWLTRPPGCGRLSPPHRCGQHDRRAALLSGALPPRHGTTARAHPPHPCLHMVPCTARISHAATSAVARCWEGDLVGGWRAGASPSTPLMRSRTNRPSSSASVAHAYTPLAGLEAL